MDANLKTRFLGCCQICEQEQKLHDGKLVHHGYKRPGHGEIVGDCYGVKADPYEVSCELVRSYLVSVEEELVHKQERLTQLQTPGAVTHLSVSKASFYSIETTEYICGVTELWTWTRQLESATHEVKYMVRQLTAEVLRLVNRILAWKLAPIRTIEERMAEEKAAKDVRAAERAAARQVKADKVAATKAKQAALSAKREAIKKDFADKFITLAATGDKTEARTLYVEMSKKKYSFFYAQELKMDEVFITLGLAERTDSGWVKYLIP